MWTCQGSADREQSLATWVRSLYLKSEWNFRPAAVYRDLPPIRPVSWKRSIELRCRRQANMKHFDSGTCSVDRDCSIALHCTGRRESNGHCSRRSSGQDRSQCTTAKNRSRKKAVMAALSNVLLDHLDVERSIRRFTGQLHGSKGILRLYWRKETENRKC